MIMDEYKMNVSSPYLSNSKLIRMLRWAVTRLLESKKVYFVLQYVWTKCLDTNTSWLDQIAKEVQKTYLFYIKEQI